MSNSLLTDAISAAVGDMTVVELGNDILFYFSGTLVLFSLLNLLLLPPTASLAHLRPRPPNLLIKFCVDSVTC